MSTYPIQNNFTSGEISPRLSSRVDFEKRNHGCETLENLLPLPHGGVTRRPGLRFVAAVKDSTKQVRLVPFEFSTTQAYIIEMGDEYMRFYKDGGIITNTAVNISGATKANPCVITSVAHGFSNGDRIIITGIVGMTELNNREFTVAGTTTNTFQLSGVNSSAYTTYVSGGTAAKIVEISTPYDETDLFEIKFAQNADTIYFTHQDYAPRKLTRSSHTSWTMTQVDWIDGPYMDEETAITITPSAASGSGITLTASAALFNANHVGYLWRLKHGSTWGYAKVTGFTSTTVVTADVKSAFGGTTASAVYREGAWSAHRGFPAAVTFHEQRLVLAGSKEEPQNIWGSKSADFEDMTPGTADADAFTYKLASNKVNAIRWLSSSTTLLIGTVGGEFSMGGGGNDDPITPSNVRVRPETRYGSNTISPLQIDTSTLYVQRAGRKLRHASFVFDTNAYESPDLSLVSEHITEGGISDMSYQQEPDSVIWLARADGVGLSLTYMPKQEVVAWARHITDGNFESFASIPAPSGDEDQTWALVKRNISGSDVRYVEYFDTALATDAALTYSGTAASVVTGAYHIRSETVDIVGDGAAYPSATVTSGGNVTLDGNSSTSIEIGLPYTPKIVTLEPEVQLEKGTSLGRNKRWARIGVTLVETLGITINGDLYESRTSDDEMDSAPELISTHINVANVGWSQKNQITIQQTQPLPFTVLAIFGLLEVGD